MRILRKCSSRWRDHLLRSCEEVQKASLFPGEDRQPGKTDRIRYQRSLHTGRDGWQESDGSCEPKPAKLAGVLSEGMLLCAEDENGELSLMVPEKKMPAGAEEYSLIIVYVLRKAREDLPEKGDSNQDFRKLK